MTKKIVSCSMILALVIGIFFLGYYYAVNNYRQTKISSNKQNTSTSVGNQQASTVDNQNVTSQEIISPDAVIKFVSNENGTEETLTSIGVNKLNINTTKQLEEMYSKGGYKLQKISQKEVVLIKQTVNYLKNKYYIGINNGQLAVYKTDDTGIRHEQSFDQIINVNSLISKPGEIDFVNSILNDSACYDTQQQVEEILGAYI